MNQSFQESLEKQLNAKTEKLQNGKGTNRYNCSICKDTEWVIDPETNYASRCECFELNISKNMLFNSGIKDGDQLKSFKNFAHSHFVNINMAKDNAIAYYKDFENIENTRNNSIMFVGQMAGSKKLGVGTGKTHLAIAITNNLLQKKKVAVRYFSYREEITKLKQSMTDKENHQRELKKWKECRVLLIDDLFKGKITESDINIMFEIINHRYLAHKPIITTTEFDTDHLDDIDQAIASRLFEMSKGHFNEMGGNGANYRYKAGE